MKKLRIYSLVISLIFFMLMIVMHSCMTFRMSEKEISKHFAERKQSVVQSSYQIGFRNMHYVAAGDSTKPMVVFVHGSPGSLSAFIDFLSDSILLAKSFLITIDRPGFGYSNFGVAEPSFEKQAALLKPILKKYENNRPIILVGHSLGGPVIARMAMDFPELIDGLVIVAGSIDPTLEPNETWFRAPLSTPFLRWILPASMRASNDEIYQAKPELERMIPLWKNIVCPVVVVHGDKDNLVPVGNVDFATRMLINSDVKVIRKTNMNHFVPWTNPELIKEGILHLLEQPLEAKSIKH